MELLSLNEGYDELFSYLDVEPLMLVHHHHRPCHTASQRAFTAFQLLQCLEDKVAHPIPEREYLSEVRPVFILLRDDRMIVAVVRIVNVRVDTALENRREALGLDEREAQEPGEEDRVERWEVSNVEERLVTQVDGLLVQHGRRDHAECNEVPGRPQRAELVGRWDSVRIGVGVKNGRGCLGEEREGERWAFKDAQGDTGGREGENEAKVGVRVEVEGGWLRELTESL